MQTKGDELQTGTETKRRTAEEVAFINRHVRKFLDYALLVSMGLVEAKIRRVSVKGKGLA